MVVQSAIAEGFGAGDAKKLEGLADAASACDLHPAAGNIMYCCSEMLEYSACYRKMRELAGSYYSRYACYLPQPSVYMATLLNTFPARANPQWRPVEATAFGGFRHWRFPAGAAADADAGAVQHSRRGGGLHHPGAGEPPRRTRGRADKSCGVHAECKPTTPFRSMVVIALTSAALLIGFACDCTVQERAARFDEGKTVRAVKRSVVRISLQICRLATISGTHCALTPCAEYRAPRGIACSRRRTRAPRRSCWARGDTCSSAITCSR